MRNDREGNSYDVNWGTIPPFAIEGLSKTTKVFEWNIRPPDQDLNSEPSEYEGVPLTRL
jgi:hypothetical protein